MIFYDDVETDMGWTLGAAGDDATRGQWKWKNPRGSVEDGYLVQAELDHTPGSALMASAGGNSIAPAPVRVVQRKDLRLLLMA